jgi:hypothetical protein
MAHGISPGKRIREPRKKFTWQGSGTHEAQWNVRFGNSVRCPRLRRRRGIGPSFLGVEIDRAESRHREEE